MFQVKTENIRAHYQNLPMQYTEIFEIVKLENFQYKMFDIFLIFAQNIDCFELSLGSNDYPQPMFWSKNKKNRYTPENPLFYIKLGFEGVYFSWTCFGDGLKYCKVLI